MPIVLEEIDDIQFITNKSGEKTAVVIPLEDKDESFRNLLAESIESRNFKNVESPVNLEKSIQALVTLIKSNNDPVFLKELGSEIENLIEKIDERIEDEFDLKMLAERAGEPTISHEEAKAQLKADGLI